ncbi:MAG: peptidoglycan editing factor PgeF [Spirochaetales bacterium]|nr:peptidoglycan editing factor PgeF [Spirochaetales bacterium]
MTQTLNYQAGDKWADIPLEQAPFGLKAIISLKNGGNMSYHLKDQLPDRMNLINSLGISSQRFYYLNQKHSQRVVTIGQNSCPENYSSIEADGLFTQNPKAVLAVTIADCLPIFLYHKSKPAFAVVHSGYKGTGIAARALELLCQELDAKPSEISVTIGPGIGSCCYNVGPERAEEFQKKYGPQVVKKQKTSYYLDLRKANLSLLSKQGVETFKVIENCTACTPDLHSYREQGPENFKLMAAVIGFF